MLEIIPIEHPKTILPPLLPPHLHLLARHLPKNAIALAASVNGVRAGISLAVIDGSGTRGTIHALQVTEPFRNQGIGSRLLIETENRLRESGCAWSQVEQHEAPDEVSESIAFAKNREYRWETTLLRQFDLSTESVIAQQWFKQCWLPDHAELFSWSALKEQERNELIPRADSYPPGMSPFLQEDRIDLEFSIGMRIDGKVAGWVIMEKLDSGMMLYRTMYVIPEYERLGIGFVMAVEATRAPGFAERYPYIRFNIFDFNRAMVRLIEKRCAEATVRTKRLIRMSKAL